MSVGTSFIMPKGFKVGHATDSSAGTGCTVITCDGGGVVGVDVRGGGPATRETDLLKPENTVDKVDAVLLAGGSAFGLDAAGGVMRWMEEQGRGVKVGAFSVPIVCGACIFDLAVGDGHVRPDAEMGYRACAEASAAVPSRGNVGAGTGASVGKILGDGLATKSGLGIASCTLGKLVVSAIVAVNAVGSILDPTSGKYLAGVRNPLRPGKALMSQDRAFKLFAKATGLLSKDELADEEFELDLGSLDVDLSGQGNTIIGCIMTNAALSKAVATKTASIAHDGIARVVRPSHTSMDGDTLFVYASGEVKAQRDVVGALAVEAVAAAVLDGVRSAEAAYGLPCAGDLA